MKTVSWYQAKWLGVGAAACPCAFCLYISDVICILRITLSPLILVVSCVDKRMFRHFSSI